MIAPDSGAKLARSVQCHVGEPIMCNSIYYSENNIIPNCSITAQDIRNVEFIWGLDFGNLKGKTVQT